VYAIEVWFACNNVGGSTTIQDSKPTLTLNVRGPNDAMLRPFNSRNLLHEL